MPTDNINHPPHYTSHSSGLECIEIVRYLPYSLGNAIKYIWRAGLKTENKLEDYKKALWFLYDFNQNDIDVWFLKLSDEVVNNLQKNINLVIKNTHCKNELLKSILKVTLTNCNLEYHQGFFSIVKKLKQMIEELECQPSTN